MCTFNGDAEVMVCDVSIASVRATVEAETPGITTYTNVPGEGTLVRLEGAGDPRLFREAVENGIRASEEPA